MKATIKNTEVCIACEQSTMFIGGMQVICSGNDQCENIVHIGGAAHDPKFSR